MSFDIKHAPVRRMDTQLLQTLFQLSAFIHFVLWFICLGSWLEWWKYKNNYTSHLYAFYRPRIAGERRPLASVPNTHTNASSTPRRRVLALNESNASSFIQDLETTYSKTCPKQASPPGKLLMLQTSIQANLGLESLTQTWMPVRHDFLIFPEISGWFILFLVFTISFAYQLYFYDRTRKKKPLDQYYFQRPCFARWMEYALTSPLQILLIASSVMIRDVYTVMLLVTAQFVCVLLGFVVECTMTMHEDNTRVYSSVPQDAVAFKSNMVPTDKAELQDTEAAQPSDPPKTSPTDAPTQTYENESGIPYTRLWLVSFLMSCILHAVVWYILVNQLANVELETTCYDGSNDWVLPLKATIYGQFVLFSLFALVPVVQKIRIRWFAKPIEATFFTGSIAYAFLSVTAKVFLGISYIFFVILFPFETR